MRHVPLLMATLIVVATSTAAGAFEGVWRTARGDHVEVHPCGEALCITVVTGEGKGLQISRDLVADGAGRLTGSLFNPEDGRTYAGSATMAGDDRLTLKGCSLRIFCKSQTWTRVR